MADYDPTHIDRKCDISASREALKLYRVILFAFALLFVCCFAHSRESHIPSLPENTVSASDSHDFTELRKLIDKEVVDADGRSLGHVWDFIFDLPRNLLSVVIFLEGVSPRIDTAKTGYKFIVPSPFFKALDREDKFVLDIRSNGLKVRDVEYFTTGEGLLSARFEKIKPGLGYKTLGIWVHERDLYRPIRPK